MLSSQPRSALLLFVLSATAYAASPCQIQSASLASSADADGGTARLLLRFSSPSGCYWAVASESEWVTLPGSAAGTNEGLSTTIPVQFAANPDPAPRRGVLRIFLNGRLHADYPFMQIGGGPAGGQPVTAATTPIRAEFGATGFNPSKIDAGSPDFTLTVTGTGFDAGTRICWGTTTLASTFVNETTITALVPGSLTELAGEVKVRASQDSCLVAWGYPFNVYPVITSYTPEYATVGDPDTLLTVDGKGFGPDMAVLVGPLVTGGTTKLPATTISSTRLTATIPASELATIDYSKYLWVNHFPVSSEPVPFNVKSDLSVLSLSPASYTIPSNGAAPLSVTFTGTGFTSDSQAQWFNSLQYTGGPLDSTFVSPTQVVATLPASLLGNAGGIYLFVNKPGSSSNRVLFDIKNDLKILSVTPNSVAPGGPSFSLTVETQGWTQGAEVLWDNTPLATTRVSATRLVATVSAGLIANAGTPSIMVRVGYQTSPPQNFLVGVVSTEPFVESIAPSSAPVGSTGVTITVGGVNFAPGSWILWNSTPLATTYVSPEQLKATVPNSLTATPNVATIRVGFPGGQTQNFTNFFVQTPISTQPVVAYVSPGSVAAGSTAFVLSVHGQTFSADHVVTWNGVTLPTTFVNAGQLDAQVSAAQVAAAGTAQVAVRTSTGSSNSVTFTIAGTGSGSGPSLTMLTPSSTVAGSASFSMTVTGAGFLGDAVVRWNGTALSTTFVNASTLYASVPQSLVASIGTAFVSVSTGSQTTVSLAFAVTMPASGAPVLTSVTPLSAPAGGGNVQISLTGSGFSPDSAVLWDGISLPRVFLSSSMLTATIPGPLMMQPGMHTITVSNNGAVSNAMSFTVTAGFSVSSMSPMSAPAGSAAIALSVTGQGFSPGDTVRWNGSPLTTTYVSSNTFTATVPASLLITAGSAQVTVLHASTDSAPLTFSITQAVTLTSINPTQIDAGSPGFTLQAAGASFTVASMITWNGNPLPTTYQSPTLISAQVPASYVATPTAASIVVREGTLRSVALSFQVKPNTPAISFLDRSTVQAGSADFDLGVTGQRFASNHVVQWNGSALVTTYASSTRLVARVPAALVAHFGTATVTVAAGTGVSNAVNLQIVANPVISSLSPEAVGVGSPDTTLAIAGSGFEPEARVYWNGAPLNATYLDSHNFSAVIPASELAQPRTAQVTVVVGGVSSAVAQFHVTARAELTALQPVQAPAGGSNVVLTLRGSGFPNTAMAFWNGEALPTSYVSSTELRATLTAARLQNAGTAQICVVASGYVSSNILVFAVVPAVQPALTFTVDSTVSDPAQPIWTLLTLNEPAPVDLAGTLELSFHPDAAAVADDYIDPATQFLSGGWTTTFRIPAGSTAANVEQNGWLQAGTVAGTLSVRLTGLALGPGSALPAEPPQASFTIARREPVATSASVRRGPDGSGSIEVTGYSTPRDLLSATLAITLDSDDDGAEPRTVVIDVQAPLTRWYDSDEGRAAGGQFRLTLPLDAAYDPAHLRSVTVRLTNSAGTSQPVPAGRAR